MNTQFFLTILSGILAVSAAVATILLKRLLNRRDATPAGPSADSKINPYAPPSTLENPANTDTDAAFPTSSPPLRSVLLTPVATVVMGTGVGIVSRLLRPYANVDGAHYDALGALLILLVGCLILISLNRGTPGPLGHWLYQLENFAMWSGFACGWSLINGAFWADMIAVSLAWCLGCAVFGSLVLLALQWLRRRRHST